MAETAGGGGEGFDLLHDVTLRGAFADVVPGFIREVDSVDAIHPAHLGGLVQWQPDGQGTMPVPVESSLDPAAGGFEALDGLIDRRGPIEIDVHDDAALVVGTGQRIACHHGFGRAAVQSGGLRGCRGFLVDLDEFTQAEVQITGYPGLQRKA